MCFLLPDSHNINMTQSFLLNSHTLPPKVVTRILKSALKRNLLNLGKIHSHISSTKTLRPLSFHAFIVVWD